MSTISDTTILFDWNIDNWFPDENNTFDSTYLDSIPKIKIKSNIVELRYSIL